MKNDERGLDALLAAAFRLEYTDELTDEQVEEILKQPIKLSAEDEATLAKIDDDYVMNVLNGVSVRSDDTQDEIALDAELEQEFYAMNRDAENKDIDEKTKRKIEEARKKVIEEKERRIKITKMDQQIRQIIDELHKLTDVPVDLDKLFKEERSIVRMPGDYGDGFEGRIEYVANDKFFIIYHPLQITNRVRFSIAHELGHYHLPSHRSLIMDGKCHSSVSGYISNKRLEREADEFAAHLLIPQSYINDLIRRIGYIPLSELVGEANKINVSLMAMAIRYIKTTPDKCALILSENGKQKFYWPSEEMEATGFGGRGKKNIPEDSVTLQALTNPWGYNNNGKAYDSSDWFSQRRSEFDLWEEAYPLGYGNFVLTMLADRDHESRY